VYNNIFRTKPMDLFRKWVVAPPSRGVQELTSIGNVKDVTPGTVKEGLEPKKVELLKVNEADRIRYINFITMPYRPNALTFEVSATAKPGWVPVWYLPWQSMKMIEVSIDPVGGSPNAPLLEPDNPNNPGLFFTAAINGCSVFVRGQSMNPTVYHGGIDGKLNVDAAEFWESCMAAVGTLDGTKNTKLQKGINRSAYVNDPKLGVDSFKTDTSVEFEKWLKEKKAGAVTIEAVYASGCVFGIRYGRNWSFYLQKSAQVKTTRVMKEADVDTSGRNPQVKGYSPATEATIVREKTESTYWGFSSRTTYTAEMSHDRPMVIQEFYPSSTGIVKVADEVRIIR